MDETHYPNYKIPFELDFPGTSLYNSILYAKNNRMVKEREGNPTETLGLWEATESNSRDRFVSGTKLRRIFKSPPNRSSGRLVTSKTRRRSILRSPKSPTPPITASASARSSRNKSKERDGTSPFGSTTLNGKSLRETSIELDLCGNEPSESSIGTTLCGSSTPSSRLTRSSSTTRATCGSGTVPSRSFRE